MKLEELIAELGKIYLEEGNLDVEYVARVVIKTYACSSTLGVRMQLLNYDANSATAFGPIERVVSFNLNGV